jgi:hypothetical protein
MVSACTTRYEAPDVTDGLAKLTVPASALHHAVESAYFGYARCTGHHPRNYPGIASWADGVRGLADELKTKGWHLVTVKGQPRVVNDDGSMAITVATGNENTGRNGTAQPRTKSGKGKTTVESVFRNGFLFPQMERDAEERIRRMQVHNLWVLLLYRDMVAGKVYCELSRPITMEQKVGKTRKQRIIGWSERIILLPVDFEPTVNAATSKENQETDAKTPEINVEIKRRG